MDQALLIDPPPLGDLAFPQLVTPSSSDIPSSHSPDFRMEEEVISNVSIKSPAFMDTAAAGWFAILEAQFHLRKITVASTKYYHVISALPPDVVAKLSPQIHVDKDYEQLKTTVISIYEKTKPELFAKLISETRMTGRPSLYLQELTAIATKVGVGEDLVKHHFTQALPPSIAPVIAAQQDLTLQRLGSLADELMPLVQHGVHQVTRGRPSNPHNSTTSSHSTGNGIPVGVRPFYKDQRPNVCRGHLYFADKSRTCKPWCRWPNKKNVSIQPNSRGSSPARGVSPEPENNPGN